MAHHQFTERPLQGLKNTSLASEGELWFSNLPRPTTSIPFLISPLISRRLGIKQVDYAELVSKKNLILWEVKTCWSNDELALRRALKIQEVLKWRKTALILSELLRLKVEVNVAVIRYQSGFSFVKNHKVV